MNIPENGIVFLNANRNSQRKRLDLTVGGFARLLKQDPTKPYYLIIVSNLNPQTGAYYDVPRIFATEVQRLGLDLRSKSVGVD
jgi:hypothetical protein